jgi:hypothetical protein
MKSYHVRQNYFKALCIYLIALLLLGLTFHSEATVKTAQQLSDSR